MNELKALIDFAGLTHAAAANLTGVALADMEREMQAATASPLLLGKLSGFLIRKWKGKGYLDHGGLLNAISGGRTDAHVDRQLAKVHTTLAAQS